jgi:epoxyqueuosine reductase QueG
LTATDELKAAARAAGADLVGVAGLGPFQASPTAPGQPDLGPFANAVSVAIGLDPAVIEGIEGAPTLAYAQHYHQANATLDRLSAQLAQWILSQGFSARAVPASKVVDETRLLGALSHKAVARLAGIGWQGKSLLIVSPQYGPRIRLATVLTNMRLAADRPLKNRCGACQACADACPASAIKNVPTEDRYESREAALHLDRCVKQMLEFKAGLGLGLPICGVCVRVCPFGAKRRRTTAPTVGGGGA